MRGVGVLWNIIYYEEMQEKLSKRVEFTELGGTPRRPVCGDISPMVWGAKRQFAALLFLQFCSQKKRGGIRQRQAFDNSEAV